VQDTVVNQLLSKIDGVQSLNNILIIGMTNRKDMIDEALLRPGRLEVHMEISLPDEAGRLQIFRIHTTKMRNENFVAPDVSLEELAARTKNYTGAEIEAVVKGATSFALYRQVDLKKVGRQQTELSSPVTKEDFLRALDENQPAFGMTSDEFENCAPNGIINFGRGFARLQKSLGMFVEQVRNSDKTPLVSVLIEGKVGTGKTALAATIAEGSDFPYVKMVSPERMVGQSEAGKCAKIARIFADSYKSPLSMIVVDNIERLLEYVQMGPRFSNTILQTLMVLIKKQPPKGHKLLIVGTTSNQRVIEHMGLSSCFNATLTMPAVISGEEVGTVLSSLGYFSNQDVNTLKNSVHEEIPIKQLLLISDLARQSTSASEPLAIRFVDCLENFAGGNGL
jgi:vesicle-fusing ATPase